jgi:hypothetical protein
LAVKRDSVMCSLHNLKVEFRFPSGIESVCLLKSIQASSGTYPMGTTGFIPRGKGRGVRLATLLHPTLRLRMRGFVPLRHHIPSWSVQGQPYVYFMFVFVFVCLFVYTDLLCLCAFLDRTCRPKTECLFSVAQ